MSRAARTRSARCSRCRWSTGQPVGDGLAQGLEQVAAVEGGGVSGDSGRAEQLGLQCSDVGCCGRSLPAEDTGDEPLRVVPGGAGLVGPSLAQRLFPDVGLGRAGGQAGALRGGGTGLPGAVELGFDLAAAGGEQPQQRPGDPGDLRPPAGRVGPGNAEPLSQLAAQDGVVDLGCGRGVPVQGAGVHRGPPAVGAMHQVGDDQVGVQLRVPGPAGGVVERGHDRPVRADPGRGLPVAVMPTQRLTRLGLQVGPGFFDSCGVRGPDLVGDVRAGQTEHKRHALRGGHCHVDPGPARIDPLTGMLHGFGVTVGAVRFPVDGVRVEPGRGGELAGAGCGHRRLVSAPAACGSANEPVIGRDHPWISEHAFHVEVLVAGNLLDRFEQRRRGQSCFRVQPQDRRQQLLAVGVPPVQHRPQRVLAGRVHLPGQAESLGAVTEPPAASLGRAGVVVRLAARLPFQVVVGRGRARAKPTDRHDHALHLQALRCVHRCPGVVATTCRNACRKRPASVRQADVIGS